MHFTGTKFLPKILLLLKHKIVKLSLNLLVGLDNGDVVHNINSVICFLIKAKWPNI